MYSNNPILLVEDDDVDAMLTQRALKELNVSNELVHTLNGEDALNYLRNEENPTPCLILLDLNMPRMNGFEFLEIAKADSSIKKIPVVVLTTSDLDENVVESFNYSVGGYIVKPVDYRQFVEAIKSLNMYWTLSKLPIKEKCTQTT